jgi:glyoxylate reductase
MSSQKNRITVGVHHPELLSRLKPLLAKNKHLELIPLRARTSKKTKSQITIVASLLSETWQKEQIRKYPALRVIANYAAGTNNVDHKHCLEHGISILNTPDVLTRSTAEIALTLLLAVAKRVPEGEALCRKGRFEGWTPNLLLGQELSGRRAVIVGEGKIGKETARLFRAIGLTVEFIRRDTPRAQIRTLLSQAQVLSLHCPLTPETHHWLNRERIELLPEDCIVINTARGPVIDEEALIQALRKKNIFGAGLDVFEREPKIPAGLRRLQSVVLLPHLGSATHEARDAMAHLLAHKILAWVEKTIS